jgi:hypothetical protein
VVARRQATSASAWSFSISLSRMWMTLPVLAATATRVHLADGTLGSTP